MAFESAADLAVFFDADGAGSAATYYAPGGASTDCTVIVGGRGELAEFAGKPPREGTVLLVQAAEIAAPARGGRFVLLVGGRSYVIVGDPALEEPDRAVWSCMCG